MTPQGGDSFAEARDALEQLLPEEDASALERARDVVTFLRLFHGDGRGERAGATASGLDRARAEVEHVERAALFSALEELLRHHLRALVPLDSFAEPQAPRVSVQAAWSSLEPLRGTLDGVPEVPGPGEAPEAVALRLLASGARHGAPPSWLSVWNALRAHAVDGPTAGEARWRELLAQIRADGLPLAHAARALDGIVRALLDVGDVRGARALLDEELLCVGCDPELAWVAAWVALLAGDEGSARELVRGRPARAGTLPLPLVELREAVPGWAPLLPGRAPLGGRAPEASCEDGRLAHHAALFGVFALTPDGAHRPLRLDAAPGTRREAELAWPGRDGAWRQAGEPEHGVLVLGEMRIEHALGSAAPRAALGGDGVRAIARVPVLDAEDEACGWIQLECEHHLLPSRARLAALARAWCDTVVSAHRAEARRPASALVAETETERGADSGSASLAPDDPRAAAARALVVRLGRKLRRRRVHVLDVEGDATLLVLEQGDALSDWTARPGGRRALRRARRSAAPVHWSTRDAGLGVHAGAGSGVVLPLAVGGRVHGLVVLESVRERDVGERDARSLAARLAGWGGDEPAPARSPAAASQARAAGVLWRAAQFRAWHRRRFGADVHLDLGARAWRARVPELFAAARARAPLAVVGAAGAGKEVLARWVHFEGEDPEGPWVVYRAGLGAPRPARGTWVLDDLEALAPVEQARLLEEVDRPGGRCVALLRSLGEASGDGRLRADLAARFEPLELHVPDLRERRDEIPALVEVLLGDPGSSDSGASDSAACDPGPGAGVGERAALELEDGALAFLWRQDWPGHVRELEGFLRRLFLLRSGGRLGAEDLQELARRFRRPLRRRLASLRPREEDLRAALESTAHRSGGWNRTRAALYLGWDPGTLAARCAERGITPADPSGPDQGEKRRGASRVPR